MREIRQNFEFIGRDADHESAKKSLQELESSGLEKKDGELEKSEKEVVLIKLADKLVADYIEAADIKYEHMDAEHVHILDKKGMDAELPNNPNAGAAYLIDSRQVIISRQGKYSDRSFFKMLLHEFIHQAAKTEFNQNYGEEGVYIMPYKSGYKTMSKTGKPIFLKLNEAITEKIASQIYINNKDRVNETLGVQDNNIEIGYVPYIDYLDDLIGKIAAMRNESRADTWARIKHGYFTGDMMHLRDIEKVLGKGGLRKYAEGDSSTNVTP